jgi:hypothetical protein
VAVPDLPAAQIAHHDVCPPKFIYDAAAGSGKTRAEVEKVISGQTQLVASFMSNDKQTKRFTPDDFTLSDEGFALTYPNGKTTFTMYRSGNGEVWTFRFPSACAKVVLC